MSLVDFDTVALYIHIPFCRRKCNYCSFVSYADREHQFADYVAALKRELNLRLQGSRISTIYFGGGTPSLMKIEQLQEIMNCINAVSPVKDVEEISLEANPGTVDKGYLLGLRKMGINRLSLGIQSFNDRELSLLGRIHNREQARHAVKFAREAGFDNLNLDIIYGIPGQTVNDLVRTLIDVIDSSPEHISLYPLTLEEDTPLWHSIKNGKIEPVNSDLAADQYEVLEDVLYRADYVHYEISNWAVDGFECRHNLTYWECQPYIGAGLAAHSYLDGHRLANTGDLDKYLSVFSGDNNDLQQVVDMDEELSTDTQLSEAIIMGLRLWEGVNVDALRNRFGVDLMERYANVIAEMTNLGLLQSYGRILKLTPQGRLLGNEVFQRFLPV